MFVCQFGPPTVRFPPLLNITFPPGAPPPEKLPTTTSFPFKSNAAPATFANTNGEVGPTGPANVGTPATFATTTPFERTVGIPARSTPPPIYVVPEYVFPVPNVSVLVPVPVAAVESVTVFPLIDATVVPGAIPPPVTA
jgi:hypothetical protein